MRRRYGFLGFTLLELIIVLIIVGVLATLGIMQYQAAIEKSRGAEARQTLSTLRSMCAAIWIDKSSTATCTDGNLGISTSGVYVAGQIPGSTCWSTNFFRYDVVVAAGNSVSLRAYRCNGDNGAGKTPSGPTGGERQLNLVTNYSTGSDTWSSTGGY
jgi:prepilin-type N-terminal cleavage/methylation domain-containing protein